MLLLLVMKGTVGLLELQIDAPAVSSVCAAVLTTALLRACRLAWKATPCAGRDATFCEVVLSSTLWPMVLSVDQWCGSAFLPAKSDVRRPSQSIWIPHNKLEASILRQHMPVVVRNLIWRADQIFCFEIQKIVMTAFSYAFNLRTLQQTVSNMLTAYDSFA